MQKTRSTTNLTEEAEQLLEQAIIYYRKRPVGTVAACDGDAESLNYDQCFIRDFVSSALIFLIQGKIDIVQNFLVETLHLQNRKKQMDCYQPRCWVDACKF
jgi:hypothetical protein